MASPSQAVLDLVARLTFDCAQAREPVGTRQVASTAARVMSRFTIARMDRTFLLVGALPG
ncbi:MAG TPA: hypothetical protein VFD21_22600 [Vicinamibacterales bacterium]|nr:hypothetical protein [Vicinamibacterales bacterium]